MPTDRLDAAPVTPFRISARWAALEHPHMAERKVVLYRIRRIESPQCRRDIARCEPREGTTLGEAEVKRELMDVRIDRTDQRARVLGEHLPFRRAEEDRERRRPSAEERNHLPPVTAEPGPFGVGDF